MCGEANIQKVLILTEVMNTKVEHAGRQYGLYVQYPEGYEG